MPELSDPSSAHSSGAMSSLEEQITQAQAEVNEQKETISKLPVESMEAGIARMQLLAMLENLAFLRKLA
jgi:hypothetical protein